MKAIVTDIDINSFTGSIPAGSDLIVYPKGNFSDDAAIVLYGFDEVGMFDSEIDGKVQYAFLRYE